MKIFLTGVAGYIGTAVTRALLKDGHEVTGLTHSPEKAAGLSAIGVTPVVGDLKNPDSYRKAADRCDVLIHAAFEYSPDGVQADRFAVETLIASASKARKPRLFIYTSGIWVLGPQNGQAATEDSPVNPLPVVAWRPAHEKLVLDAAAGEFRTAVVRPGCVYGNCGGLYGMMFRSVFDRRVIRVVGDGANCWASVYLEDLADLYRLMVARSKISGVYHATDESPEPLGRVAQALIDAAGGGEVQYVTMDAARKEMGPMAEALAVDQRVSSPRAKAELGWSPALRSVAKNAQILLEQWHEKAGPMTVA